MQYIGYLEKNAAIDLLDVNKGTEMDWGTE